MTEDMVQAAGISDLMEYGKPYIPYSILPISCDVKFLLNHVSSANKRDMIINKHTYSLIPWTLEYQGNIYLYALGCDIGEEVVTFNVKYGSRFCVIGVARNT